MYGLYSYGRYGYGLHSYGLHSHGTQLKAALDESLIAANTVATSSKTAPPTPQPVRACRM